MAGRRVGGQRGAMTPGNLSNESVETAGELATGLVARAGGITGCSERPPGFLVVPMAGPTVPGVHESSPSISYDIYVVVPHPFTPSLPIIPPHIILARPASQGRAAIKDGRYEHLICIHLPGNLCGEGCLVL
eukprot:superscaffoldBa00007352_g22451